MAAGSTTIATDYTVGFPLLPASDGADWGITANWSMTANFDDTPHIKCYPVRYR